MFAGGALGTALRYAVEEAWVHGDTGWPVATFVVNVVGAFVLGLLLEMLMRRGPDTGRRRSIRLLLGTGFCGAFTTYSTFALETVRLAENGAVATGVAYAAVSVVAGAVAAFAGIAVGGAVGSRARR